MYNTLVKQMRRKGCFGDIFFGIIKLQYEDFLAKLSFEFFMKKLKYGHKLKTILHKKGKKKAKSFGVVINRSKKVP